MIISIAAIVIRRVSENPVELNENGNHGKLFSFFKGPRWASWNLGIFLCIRCAGIHRNLGEQASLSVSVLITHSHSFLFVGVHISRVKSVNLDTWAPEQVVSLQQMGNSRARAVYEALLADNFRRPQTDSGLESFVRAKYEQKKYIAREWIPPPPITKVDWDKEIEEEIENQKRKKKPTTASIASIPEPAKLAPSPVNVSIPAPPHSPKTSSRAEAKKSVTSNSMDLLGLDTSTSSTLSATLTAPTNVVKPVALIGDGFDVFASASPSPAKVPQPSVPLKAATTEDTLAQEENDFFNQKTADNGAGEKGKLTRDSILALYGNAPSFPAPQAQQFNANFPVAGQDQFFAYGQQPGAPLYTPVPPQSQPFGAAGAQQPMMFNGNNGNFGAFNANLGTMQTQQINKLNELNIKKIESLNFNNFK